MLACLGCSLTNMAIQFKVWLLVCHYHTVNNPIPLVRGMYCLLLIKITLIARLHNVYYR